MPHTTPEVAPIAGGVQLFRSCMVSSEYPGAEAATKWLFERLGVEYIVNPEQTCCTGLGYYTDVMPFATTVAIAARNACVAVEAGHPVQAYLCSTCYAINKKAHRVLEDPEQRREVNRALAGIGRSYDDEVARTIQHRHVLEVLWSQHEKLAGLVRRRLGGIKVATHPACHYCKVFPDEVLGDSENLMVAEDLLEPAGVTRTGYYPEKTTHCGAGFRQRFVNPSMSMAVTREKLRRLAAEKVDVCVHMCPNCAVQFDRHHDVIERTSHEEYPFVHLHVQQLVALALGADPDTVCGVGSHSQDLEPLLQRIGARPGPRCDPQRRLPLRVRRQHLGRARPRARWPTGGRGMEGVVNVAVCQFLCGAEGRRLIEGLVSSRGLDRVVIGACSRRFQGPTFERIARELELGENSVAFANLREGCAFIHRQEPERAQRKAETVLAAAVARAASQRPLEPSRTFLHRSALVVGGGIGGLSAAEELAGAGIEVHLVEREQSLGGYMARLSKTFPTEDCAMCSLGPRLANAATDSRIHVNTLSEVTSVSGPPGEFRVTGPPPARASSATSAWVAGPARPPARSSWRASSTSGSPAARRSPGPSPTRCRRPSRSTTAAGPPAPRPARRTPSAQGYIALAAQGRWEEAYRVASEPNPFPSVCGRICPHACEEECTRGRLDQPVAIAGIKRFVADQVGAALPVAAAAVRFEDRVAVVGAGPAGLTAARDLARLGYPVTVFEAQPVAGGMLALGVPEYRLPREVVAAEVARVLAARGGAALRAALRPRLHRRTRCSARGTGRSCSPSGCRGRAPCRSPARSCPGWSAGWRCSAPGRSATLPRSGGGSWSSGAATSPSTRPAPRCGSAPSA